MRPSDNTPLTAAQAKLVKTHAEWARRGAYKNAAKWSRYVTVDDLMSAAYLGLVMAARKFDPSRGFSFKTLAMTYCESLMRREIDTLRRQNGCVFDPRVEGGMRTVVQRVDWPTYDDGRPRDLATVPAPQHQSADLAQRRELLRRAATHHDRRLVRLVLEGHTAVEIARELRVSPKTVANRLEGLTRRIKSRIAAGKAA